MNTPVRFVTHPIPVPDTSVTSVGPQYRYIDTSVSWFFNTGTRHIMGKDIQGGIYSTKVVRYRRPQSPYRKLRYGSLRTRYWYPTLREVRYDFSTGTRYFGKFGTISMPITDASVSLVRPPKIPRVIRLILGTRLVTFYL